MAQSTDRYTISIELDRTLADDFRASVSTPLEDPDNDGRCTAGGLGNLIRGIGGTGGAGGRIGDGMVSWPFSETGDPMNVLDPKERPEGEYSALSSATSGEWFSD